LFETALAEYSDRYNGAGRTTQVGPTVRIHFPPAASPVRTWLPRS